MYFKFFNLHRWGKRSTSYRRRFIQSFHNSFPSNLLIMHKHIILFLYTLSIDKYILFRYTVFRLAKLKIKES